MKNNLLFEDIQRFKSIINYNPSVGLINEGALDIFLKSLTKESIKVSLRTFLKDTLKVELRTATTQLIKADGKTLTQEGKKFVEEILEKGGKKGLKATDDIDKITMWRIVKDAQDLIDNKAFSTVGKNISREEVVKAFTVMTKSQNLSKETIEKILTNFKTSKNLFKAINTANRKASILNEISQSLYKKPYLDLTYLEREAIQKTINAMNPVRLQKELARQLIQKAPQQTSKLKKLWGGLKKIPTSKILKWASLTLLSVASIWAIIHYWDKDVTKEDDEKIDDGGGGNGGGGNGGGGGGSTSYTQCSDFPYKKNCSSPIVAEVQKCLGLYNDGKFGPKTEAKLVEKGYGTEITKEVYDKIKEKCGTNTITEPIKVNPEYVDPNKIVYTDTEFENL